VTAPLADCAALQGRGHLGRLVDRPGLQRLLADVRAGKVDVVVVPNISRFFRKLDTLLTTMKILKDHGVGFISLSENLDFTTKWGKLILSVLGTLAEIYIDDLSETTSRGKQQRARKGLFNGSLPTGYCTGMCATCTDPNGPGYCPFVGLRPIGDGKNPVLHPLESQAVRLAFEWYATGQFSDADIAYKLSQYRYQFQGQEYPLRPKRKGGDLYRYTRPLEFTKGTLREILRRRFYIGEVEYRGGQGVAEERRKFKKAQAIYSGQQPLLISRELFEQAQAVRRQRGYRTTRPSPARNGFTRWDDCCTPLRAAKWDRSPTAAATVSTGIGPILTARPWSRARNGFSPMSGPSGWNRRYLAC
jgi:hypothetical protein